MCYNGDQITAIVSLLKDFIYFLFFFLFEFSFNSLHLFVFVVAIGLPLIWSEFSIVYKRIISALFMYTIHSGNNVLRRYHHLTATRPIIFVIVRYKKLGYTQIPKKSSKINLTNQFKIRRQAVYVCLFYFLYAPGSVSMLAHPRICWLSVVMIQLCAQFLCLYTYFFVGVFLCTQDKM